MSSPSKDASRSVYHDAFPDDSRVPSPSSSSTSSSSSSSDSNSKKRKVTRGPPKWNPFERYPEFLERDKWLKEENKLLSEEEEEEFQRFVYGYEKYKAKDKAGEPFWEELRRSLPSFSLDAAQDERYFIGYDEEGNEVRYNDEKHLLKRVRQSEILKFQADCRKAMQQREECRKRREEEKIRKRDGKENQEKDKRATRKYDLSFVGKKQGPWRKRGFKGMNAEMKKVVTRDGESQYVAVNKTQEGRKSPTLQERDTSSEKESTVTKKSIIVSKKMAGKNNKRPICKDEADNGLQTAKKKMNAVSYGFEKNADSDFGEDNILFHIRTSDKPGHSGERSNMGDSRDDDEAKESRRGEEFAFDGKYLSDDEKEESELEKRRGNDKHRNRKNNKDDEADGFEYKVTEEDYIIPGFEEEKKFSGDEIDNGSDIEHLLEILERTENVSRTPRRDDTLKTKETHKTEDVETEEMHDYKTKTGDKKKINPEKAEETEEEDSIGEDEENEEGDSKMGDGGEMKTAIIFRHSSRFQKELEEKQMKEVRQKVLNDLADMDVTIELLMMDLEGRDASDNEEESETE